MILAAKKTSELIMRLRTYISAVVVFFATSGLVKAQAPEETLYKIARSIVRISMVGRVCSVHYLVDEKLRSEVEKGFLQEGLERFGQGPLRLAVNRVEPEFFAQIKSQGAAVWCPAQRQRYKHPGFPEFIGGPVDQ